LQGKCPGIGIKSVLFLALIIYPEIQGILERAKISVPGFRNEVITVQIDISQETDFPVSC